MKSGKNLKRLVLKKATIINLSNAEQANAHGGATGISYCYCPTEVGIICGYSALCMTDTDETMNQANCHTDTCYETQVSYCPGNC